MGYSINEKIKYHIKYWNREEMDTPIISFKIAPDFFFSTHFSEAKKLLGSHKRITPEMINVDAFMEDYINVVHEIEEIGQNAFWVAEPFTGFPWLEAICGCEVYATEDSFNSSPIISSPIEYEKIYLDYDNKWYKKYMEFSSKLNSQFKGKYPIGEPIMRGISDVIGALLGQTEMVYGMYDYPEEIKLMAERITNIFIEVIKNQQDIVSPVGGGYAMGFYHIWCPEKCIWFQEDLTSLMSPTQYVEFIKDSHKKICNYSNYTLMHLHSSSFHMIDEFLKLKNLKVIEINKDVGGLPIEDMIPVFQKVQSNNKNLCIWGDLDIPEIDKVLNSLEPKGIFFNIISPTVYEAKKIMEFIENRKC